jgi:hypothetical protein
MYRLVFEDKYFELGNSLPKTYPDLNFDNHCYWRISLDNALGDFWKNIVKSPAYKNLSDEELIKAVELLEDYNTDKDLLIEHNKNSLRWRGKLKD